MLPIGFQTVSRTIGTKSLAALDKKVERWAGAEGRDPVLIPLGEAVEMLDLAYANLTFDDGDDSEHKAHMAALGHLSRTSTDHAFKGKVWLLVARDRNVARYREEGRFSNAPDTKQQADLAQAKADTIPVLALFRQNGKEEKGWRDLPFWWPVIVTPRSATTSIFASETPSSPNGS
jgi:hypothetical protein